MKKDKSQKKVGFASKSIYEKIKREDSLNTSKEEKSAQEEMEEKIKKAYHIHFQNQEKRKERQKN